MALPDGIDIKTISTSSVIYEGSRITIIHGLGNDNIVYRWEAMPVTWYAEVN